MTSNEWGAQIIFWLVNAAINSVVLWVVINRILGSPGEAGFMKCAGCSLLVSILGGLGMRIGVFIGAIVGTFVGIFLAFISPTAGLIAGVVLGLGIAIFWWWRFAHWALKTVLDLPGGQGNTILIVYAVGSILIKVVLVMGMGIGTIAFLSGMQGGRSASPGSSLSASLDESGAAGEMEGSKQFVEAAAEEFAGQVAAELNKMLGEQGSASSIQTSVVVKDSSGSRSESYDMKGRFVRGLASGGVAQDMEPAEAAAQLKQEFDAAMAEPAVESPGTTGEPDPLAGVEAEETMRAPGKGADPEEIKRANELVQQARLKWNEGDYKGSLAAGDEAVAILKANLPEGNPKLRKVMRMSATAKERAATKGIE